MFNERDRRSATIQLMLFTDPSYDYRTITSTLKMLIWIATNNRDVSRVMRNKVSGYSYSLWCGFKWEPHHATTQFRSRHESRHQIIPGCAEECGHPLVQSGGRWQTWSEASPKRPRLGFRMSASTLCSSLTGPLLPRQEPAGLLRLLIRREHHQHDLPQHQTQPDRCHQLNIRRAPAGACGKGMLLVPDPYGGGDWVWMRLHWIDVSSTT